MATVLNQFLYDRLASHCGQVTIANEGEGLIEKKKMSLLANRGREEAGEKKQRNSIIHAGEYYRVNCPYCNDTRRRLWVNHRANEFPFLMVCYNEDCMDNRITRDALLFSLYKGRPPRTPPANKGSREAASLKQIEPPGRLQRLDELPLSHHANDYLSGRGYDPWLLGKQYGISYCEESRYRQCSDKIIIPIVMNRKLVGFQARFIGDRDWKSSSSPKYWDMPGMHKRLMLYNHDQARRYPWVVLQEGVTDVWSTGPMAMSLLGSTLSYRQRLLLAFPPFRDRPVVVMLDGDARLNNEEMTEQLKREHPAGVVMVDLPEDADPGSFSQEVNLDIIYTAAEAQGVHLVTGEAR